MKRTDWYVNAKFGMLIHWGLYAIPARGEWVRSVEKISIEDYQKYFDEFNPTDYDPVYWAKLAKKAGIKYAVLTTKHHDGFCLFDSKYTDYKSTNTKAKRDLVREFVDAFRAEGIKIGLYYSLIDWHHKDYPKYDDLIHPMRGNPAYKDDKYDLDNYIKYMHNQIEELATNYGKIDIFWFDYSYGKMNADTWKAKELMEMVRKHQPDVLIDNRLDGSGMEFNGIMSENPSNYAGDFASPEQFIPDKGMVNCKGERIPWETITTLNNTWGYNSTDKAFKTSKMIIRKLVEIASKNGNLVINIGPDARGNIQKEVVDIFNELGEWMSIYGESIFDTTASSLDKPEFGRYTQKGNSLYAHILEQPLGAIPLLGIDKDNILSARRVSDGSELLITADTFAAGYFKNNAFVSLGDVAHYTYKLENDTDTVIKIQLKKI